MSVEIRIGDCRDILPGLPAESVQCCVTSPPYWGLRDYGTAEWEGGESGCDHRSPSMRAGRNEDRATLGGGIMATNSYQLRYAAQQGICGKCGARRIDRQIGLEPTPGAYVAALVAVFEQVRRVLRADGTLWLNLGDSYSGGGPHHGDKNLGKSGTNTGSATGLDRIGIPGLKPKDLVGIPWRVAFALQAAGWWLRSDIIWAKPNPMPESVTDRPTKAHEYLFLLAKSERYVYDAAAIAEPVTGNAHPRGNGVNPKCVEPGRGIKQNQSFSAAVSGLVEIRNRRSVWTVATQPYPEAHFATFPPKLIEPCILAGSRPGDTVLDPFAGSGTTLQVADRMGRHGLGIELNRNYRPLIEARTAQAGLPL